MNLAMSSITLNFLFENIMVSSLITVFNVAKHFLRSRNIDEIEPVNKANLKTLII